jgi:hypothetical protein
VKGCILVLPESGVAAATGSPPALSATISGSPTGASAKAAFYTGVNQSTPASAVRADGNGAATVAYPSAMSVEALGVHFVAIGGRAGATQGTLTPTPSGNTFTRQGTVQLTNAALDVFQRPAASAESTSLSYTWGGTSAGSAILGVALKGAGGPPAAGALTRASSTVTVTTLTNHGLAAGDVVALTPGHDLFRAGWKTVASIVSTTKFTYTEAGTAGSIPGDSNQYFVKTSTRAKTPFNTTDTLQNARENGSHSIRAWRATNNKVINVKSQFNSDNLAGSEFASHHNLNQFTKRYSSKWLPTGAWEAYTTKDGVVLNSATAGVGGEVAGLHCSDCHLNETNAHGTRNTWYMLASANQTDGTTLAEPFDMPVSGPGTSTYNSNCIRCHPATVYSGATSTSSRANHGDCPREGADDRLTWLGSSWVSGTVSAGTAVYGVSTLQCLGCHGGRGDTNLGPGLIHGTNENYKPMNTGTSKMYRFMGSGASYPYYSPDGTDANMNWSGTTSGNCYNIVSANGQTDWGGCSQHTGGQSTPVTGARGLSY